LQACRAGAFDAVIACPHHETAIHQAGIAFSGYPSLVARVCGVPEDDVFLLLVGGGLRIVHATLHESVRTALGRLTPELVEKAVRAGARAMALLGVDNPTIGVFGINPHASEGTLFGPEDQAIVVPEHVGGLVHGLGFRHVQELRHWESFELGSLKVTLTPARHWGARVLHDSHRGFGGFHIEYAGRSVFHCGDSAYFEGFKEIGERLPVEIALLPIGAYEAPTKRDVHMNPEQAIEAFMKLGAKTFVPMHFGTFRLSYEPLHEPPERLIRNGAERQILEQICILNEGEPRVF
jgi:L-ascorbate metabolism protein UlaG (beta-lactamase superfamily)